MEYGDKSSVNSLNSQLQSPSGYALVGKWMMAMLNMPLLTLPPLDLDLIQETLCSLDLAWGHSWGGCPDLEMEIVIQGS